MEIEIIEPDYYYHVYNRGINRQPIFTDETHYYKFLSLTKKYLTGNSDVLAYCLIPNHFHLLLYFHPDKNAGKTVKPLSNLLNAYAQWFNIRTDRVGNLFQRPFKRKKITTHEYLRQLIYYIHRNPLHHKVIEDPTEYPFSSYQSFLNNFPSFISKDIVLEWFDGPGNFEDFHQMNFEIYENDLLLEE